jgi:hypothetical protein
MDNHREFMVAMYLQNIQRMTHLLKTCNFDLRANNNQIKSELKCGRLTPASTYVIHEAITMRPPKIDPALNINHDQPPGDFHI